MEQDPKHVSLVGTSDLEIMQMDGCDTIQWSHGATGALSTLICDKSNELITPMCKLQIGDREKYAHQNFVDFSKRQTVTDNELYVWRNKQAHDKEELKKLLAEYQEASAKMVAKMASPLDVTPEEYEEIEEISKSMINLQKKIHDFNNKILVANEQIGILEKDTNVGYKGMKTKFNNFLEMAEGTYGKPE